MAKVKEKQDVRAILDDIDERLDSLEMLASFSVNADQRFKKGQRVQFSKQADRRDIRAKGGVRKGTVTDMKGFTVYVLMDGYKKPHGYHHAFFDPIGRRA